VANDDGSPGYTWHFDFRANYYASCRSIWVVRLVGKVDMQAINLKNGIRAVLILEPMPLALPDGKYRPMQGVQPEVFVAFSKNNGEVLAQKVRWCSLIANGVKSYEIVSGAVLDSDDLEVLDEEGWDIMLGYGMFPTELVLS
jgi:hypothetical protein